MSTSMDVPEILKGVLPLAGKVVPVKTTQEVRPREEFADAYVAEVNVKSASKVNKAVDAAFPRDPSQPLHHVRRFAKHNQLPDALRPILIKGEPSPQTIFVMIYPPLPEADAIKKLLVPFVPTPAEPSSTETPLDANQIPLHTVRIPLQPPINPAQAEKWSSECWPVIYNPAAPKGNIAPPLQVLGRARESIEPNAGHYLALARKVAEEAEQSGMGRRVGAVVVDPELEAQIDATGEDGDARWADAVVAVAGDARYSRREAGALSESELQLAKGLNPARETYNPDLEGGPELHALMRAADMIASKRRESTQDDSADAPRLNPLEAYFISQSDVSASGSLLDPKDPPPHPEKYQKTDSAAIPKPSEEAQSTPRIRSRTQGGYLCTDLDVYLSREPCVCCSMGLLLSRFRAVIFPRRGRMVTGGLASEPVIAPVMNEDGEKQEVAEPPADSGAGSEEESQPHRMYYGLHWRKELNWRALGFEFVEDGLADGDTEAKEVAFHA